jgi:hypothetical protein
MSAKFSFLLLALLLLLPHFGPYLTLGQDAPSVPRRVKVSDIAAASLIAEKMPPKLSRCCSQCGYPSQCRAETGSR